MTFGRSGTGTGIKKSIREVREREGNGKNPFPKFGNGKGMKKSIPKIREREENEKNPFQHFGNGNQRLLFPGINGNGNGTKKLRLLELIENFVICSENKGRVPKKTFLRNRR